MTSVGIDSGIESFWERSSQPFGGRQQRSLSISTPIPHSLNSIPIESVDSTAVSGFCALQRDEGIDLDYKQDWPTDLDALLAAFANTQGGLLLVGVEEEGKSRRPKLPLIGVDGDPADLRQRVLNIAFDAVFPPVQPEIAICTLPSSTKSVVVVRVPPSRLMHAVDRRTRVYIRVADSKRGYSLADLPALEWLWAQRSDSIQLRDSIRSIAETRSSSGAIPWTNTGDSDRWEHNPLLTISAIPQFPSPSPSLSPRDLLDVANSLHQLRSHWRLVDVRFPSDPLSWRTISGGVCVAKRGPSQQLQYAELGQLGSLFAAFHIEPRAIGEPPAHRCIPAYSLLARIDITLRYASAFLNSIGFRSPSIVRCILRRADLTRLFYKRPGQTDPFDLDWLTQHLPDSTVTLIDVEVNPLELQAAHNRLMVSSATSLFWAYGLGWNINDIESWYANLSGPAPA